MPPGADGAAPRLAFNATALLNPLTGIGHYAYHLGEGLLARGDWDVEFFYGAFWDRRLRAGARPMLAKALPWARRHLPFSYELRGWVQNFRFTRHARRRRCQLYHEPNILPLRFDGPTVITVHDLSWIRHPEAHPIERVRAMNARFEPGLRRADAVITDSAFVRREIIDLFGLDPARITAIPLGVETMFRPRGEAETRATLERHRLSHRRYLLTVGTLEPRKNLIVALRAFQSLPAAIRRSHPLVIAGMTGWDAGAIEAEIEPLTRAGEVRQLGYVARADLASLIAGATALLYPSIYEGFGLPPLEAMASATPVICADASSLPELVGGAGALIDPHDAPALAATLRRVIEDTAWAADLGRRGRVRAAGFDWARCVEATAAVYRTVVR